MYTSSAASRAERRSHEIKETFELFDTGKDGTIDYPELEVAMRALGFDLKKAKVLKTLRDHDKMGHNLLMEGWGAAGEKAVTESISARDPMDEIRSAFQLFDDDNRGRIPIHNLRQAMIDDFDLNQDGEINEQEFFGIMTDDA
ncbi:hypothetical protein BJV74DRAFT_953088 [Russula compacta]|nr:hypothetical protein BJV74DRAFT_953088 [Russula compacta]